MNGILIAILFLVLVLVLALALLVSQRSAPSVLQPPPLLGGAAADVEREALVVVVLSADADDDEPALEKQAGQQVVDAFMKASYFRDILVEQKALLPDVPPDVFPRWYLQHPFDRIIVVAVGPAAAEVACEMRRQGGDRVAGIVLVGPGPLVPLIPPEAAARFEGAEQASRLAARRLAENIAALKSLTPGGVKVFVTGPELGGGGGAAAYARELGAAAVVAAKWSAAAAKKVSKAINAMMRQSVGE